jgi:hypothetical protein
MHQEHTINLYT